MFTHQTYSRPTQTALLELRLIMSTRINGNGDSEVGLVKVKVPPFELYCGKLEPSRSREQIIVSPNLHAHLCSDNT